MILCEGADGGWMFELIWVDDMGVMWVAGQRNELREM